jgi:DNA-directed RNA polymerase subunit RPC12/RpoP
MNLKYTCKYCGKTNEINSFWKWFFTPHFGAKKWLKCKHCESKRHFMTRQNWTGPCWIDWPKDSK